MSGIMSMGRGRGKGVFDWGLVGDGGVGVVLLEAAFV